MGSNEERLEAEINRLKRKFDEERRQKEVKEAENKKLKHALKQAQDSARLSSKIEESWHLTLKDYQRDLQNKETRLIEAKSDLRMARLEKLHEKEQTERIQSEYEELRELFDAQEHRGLIKDRNLLILEHRYKQAVETNNYLREVMDTHYEGVTKAMECPVTLTSVYDQPDGMCVLNCGHMMAVTAFDNNEFKAKQCPVCRVKITTATNVRFMSDFLQQMRLLAQNFINLPVVHNMPPIEEKPLEAQRGSLRRHVDHEAQGGSSRHHVASSSDSDSQQGDD